MDDNNVDAKALATLGVSVHWLQTGFMEEVQAAGFDESATIYNIEPTVIREKGKDTTCPVDGRIGASYAHALLLRCLEQNNEKSVVVGPANFMLSYGWRYAVRDIVETLVDFCQSSSLDPKDTYIWICCLCNNQHRVKEIH
ncbi:expressed unknown protein (Partial), partial [Seminavis robusta]|eukprot:Sro1091_g240220.1 n/a (140) ;mRNA; r:2-421